MQRKTAIGEGVAALKAGDTLTIMPGEYREQVSVTLVGTRTRADAADALHHALGLALTATCMAATPPARLAHHMLVTEASTPLLNAMWVLKKLGLEQISDTGALATM